MSNPILTTTNSKLDTRVKEPSGVVPPPSGVGSPTPGPGSLDRFIVIIETCVIKFLKTIRLTITFVIHGIPNSLTNLPILNNKSKLTHEITILLSFIKKSKCKFCKVVFLKNLNLS